MINKQLVAKKIGVSGCYFLSLVYIVEQKLKKDIDVILLYEKSVKAGWMGDDCYMKNPAEMLVELTNKKCSVRHESANYKPLEDEFEITRYEYNDTGTTFAHFVVTDKNKIIYDPFGNSRTVKFGKPVSKRIIKIC